MQNADELILTEYKGDIRRFVSDMRKAASDASKAKTAKRTTEYRRWRNIMARCYDKSHHAYGSYGGRGISVCERWQKFAAYYEDMGVPPKAGMSIDRIDVNGNYEPGNCRWATAKEQAANKRPREVKGSVCKVDGRWRALVRINGYSAVRRFDDETVARDWSAETARTFAVLP